MATYLVCYDINKEGDAYRSANEALIKRIKELFDTWWHHLDSTWIVVTEMSATQIRDALGKHLDADDELLVVKSGHEAAWSGFNQKGSDWLKNHL